MFSRDVARCRPLLDAARCAPIPVLELSVHAAVKRDREMEPHASFFLAGFGGRGILRLRRGGGGARSDARDVLRPAPRPRSRLRGSLFATLDADIGFPASRNPAFWKRLSRRSASRSAARTHLAQLHHDAPRRTRHGPSVGGVGSTVGSGVYGYGSSAPFAAS